jgi:hypothetical protein
LNVNTDAGVKRVTVSARVTDREEHEKVVILTLDLGGDMKVEGTTTVLGRTITWEWHGN